MANGVMTSSDARHKLLDDPSLKFLGVSLSFQSMTSTADR